MSPADGVADVAGVYVPAVDIDLLLQSEGAPGRGDPLAPSVPGVGHVTPSRGRAVQSHSALPTARGLRPLQQLQLRLPNRVWKQRFRSGRRSKHQPAHREGHSPNTDTLKLWVVTLPVSLVTSSE